MARIKARMTAEQEAVWETNHAAYLETYREGLVGLMAGTLTRAEHDARLRQADAARRQAIYQAGIVPGASKRDRVLARAA